jgi:hypothetical protein
MIVFVEVEEGGEVRRIARPIGHQYGLTPEIALEWLQVALMRAERPLLVDTEGAVWEFPSGSVRKIVLREEHRGPHS